MGNKAAKTTATIDTSKGLRRKKKAKYVLQKSNKKQTKRSIAFEDNGVQENENNASVNPEDFNDKDDNDEKKEVDTDQHATREQMHLLSDSTTALSAGGFEFSAEKKGEDLDIPALCSSVSNCSSVRIVLNQSSYYSTLDLKKVDDRKKFLQFIDNKCLKEALIDHFIHIVTKHVNETEIIFGIAVEEYFYEVCDVTNCKLTVRHTRNRGEHKTEETHDHDNELGVDIVFWRDLFDNIHCYLCHIYDFGYRSKTHSMKN
eukprot:398283_1